MQLLMIFQSFLTPTEMAKWLILVEQAPPYIRGLLEVSYWLLFLVGLLAGILWLLQSKGFRVLYAAALKAAPHILRGLKRFWR